MSLGLRELPPSASGVSSRLLRKRLTAIMRGASHPPWLTPEACAGVWMLAVLVLVPCPAIWQAFGGTTAVLSDNVVARVLPGRDGFEEPSKTSAAVKPTTADFISWPFSDRLSLFAKSPGGQFLLTLGCDQRACLREFSIPIGRIPGMEPRRELDLGVGRVASADFSPNDQLLAIGGLDGTVELIDCHGGRTQRRWSAGSTAVLSVAFSPDGQHLAIGNRAGDCQVFQISPFGSETIQRERGKRISCVRYSADGSCLAVVNGNSRESQVDVWDLVSGRSCGSLRPEQTVAAVLATKTADEWLIVERDGTARVWSTNGHLASANSIVTQGSPSSAQIRPNAGRNVGKAGSRQISRILLLAASNYTERREDGGSTSTFPDCALLTDGTLRQSGLYAGS